MNKRIFSFARGKIPKISNTELIALRSGNTSLDRQILQGKITYPERKPQKPSTFDVKKVDELLDFFDDKEIKRSYIPQKTIDFLAKNKFFSFLISEKYGGHKLSTI